MMAPRSVLGVCLACALAAAGDASAAGPSRADCATAQTACGEASTDDIVAAVSRDWFRNEWQAYAAKFVTPEGRIVDNANNDVSHSEGQGYGMLLAVHAQDREAFDRIWSWTRGHLQTREDRLLSWRWDPKTRSVTDPNNASDGDILVAWALARAAKAFDRADYLAAARQIAQALAAHALVETPFGTALSPAVHGFGAKDRPDGPVFNPSYWIYPAFPTLAELDPEHDWMAVKRTGLAILSHDRVGEKALPSDWVALAQGRAAPARGLSADFGYDAIRIPLYLLWSDDGDEGYRRALSRFVDLWRAPMPPQPAVISASGGGATPFSGAGYALVASLTLCAAGAAEVEPDLLRRRDAHYYPETLRLLCLIAMQERVSRCL
jgi:endoglucanase